MTRPLTANVYIQLRKQYLQYNHHLQSLLQLDIKKDEPCPYLTRYCEVSLFHRVPNFTIGWKRCRLSMQSLIILSCSWQYSILHCLYLESLDPFQSMPPHHYQHTFPAERNTNIVILCLIIYIITLSLTERWYFFKPIFSSLWFTVFWHFYSHSQQETN